MSEIQLGDIGKDLQSGFKGMVVSRQMHMNGCNHICLQPPVKKDGELPESRWFDEPLVEFVKKRSVKIKKRIAGLEPDELGGPILTSRNNRRN